MTQANIRFSRLILATAATLCAVAPASADTINRCARYGADYAAVSGSNSCVRIGGHVRVELGRPQTVAPMGYAAQDGVVPAAARVAQQPLTPFDIFPR